MKNKKNCIIIIVIAVTLIASSVFAGYLIGVKSSLYQGTTARDWAADYANDEQIIELSHNCKQVYKNVSERKNHLATPDEYLACGQVPTQTAAPSPTTTPAPVTYNSHAGMIELKGTSCDGQTDRNEIHMNCEPYDLSAPKNTNNGTTVDPNAGNTMQASGFTPHSY